MCTVADEIYLFHKHINMIIEIFGQSWDLGLNVTLTPRLTKDLSGIKWYQSNFKCFWPILNCHKKYNNNNNKKSLSKNVCELKWFFNLSLRTKKSVSLKLVRGEDFVNSYMCFSDSGRA